MDKNSDIKQFNFGENWDNFSKNFLNEVALQKARNFFDELLQNQDLKDKSFIDIGFGQGIIILLALEKGAKVIGNDINPLSEKILHFNLNKYFKHSNFQIPVVIGSFLEDNTISDIKKNQQSFNIVHSWGVLHHTGKMWIAIDNACNLVNDNGKLILAIYNKHWTSYTWLLIKKLYVYSPKFIKKLMIGIFYFIILIAKFLVTFKNPYKMERGMDFYYNVVDWVGGYPYEYATKEEIQNYIESKGFKLVYFRKAQVPTGCNEFVFQKI